MSIALKQVFNKDKTFRPKRKFEPGTQRFELHKRAQATLNSGVDLKAAVQLPSGEDQNDWVAVHVVDFFNRINLIYGTICEFCTEKTCPVMSGGPKYEYRWQDDMKYKKPTALPAPQYMNLLMDWIEVQINNENIFPTNVGVPFPKNFLQICKKILCRLFRVFVHVYIHHFDRIILMGAEAHVNTCYKHFYYFVTELNLIDRKELEPLYSTLYEAKEGNAELNSKGFVFDLVKFPAIGRTHYNPGAEPATEKYKMYLFWLLTLLGRTWSFQGDEINLLQVAGFWPLAVYLPTGTLASTAEIPSHGLTIPCHGPFLLFPCLVFDIPIRTMSGTWHHYITVSYYPFP
ncbi:MOB kinase activator 3B isoform X1 [Tyto alba]|uniref:MOB kinase activator 3B isoform X1 n=2 Tax=Tyto alba TaxID=56313 RepID=UPI001C666E82|nr:MOB kinase activator 3B isoform X1 [Tyto alba]XP_032865890.2 MOB kinase activator 3B isoform X1 [Tyto alba]XP_032865891.2 MOB kinase activator 3B isoform X1 [Tyto alba]XP_032865892.2 MOB kinase activator 3B isoform X1 [Tyto alba]